MTIIFNKQLGKIIMKTILHISTTHELIKELQDKHFTKVL